MAFDVAAAKRAGYSDAEIAEFLGQQKGFDAAGAMKAGYTPTELIEHLGGAAPRKSTIGSELKRGAQQVASSMQTAFGAVTGSPEEAAKAGLERGEAISQVAGEGASLAAVKRAYQDKGLLSAAGEAASQIPRALAGQGANLATLATGARLGAMAGSAVAPGPGTVIGGVLGAGAAMYPQFFGSDVESQAAAQMERGEPVKIDRTKAGVAAAGQSALEGAGAAFTLGKGVVKGILGITDDAAVTSAKAAKQLEETARRSLTGTVARGAGRGAVVGIPVEVAQQVIERAQAGLDLTSPDALAEYGEAAYQAGLVGGPLGAAGNVVTRSQAKGQVAKAEDDAAAAARAAAQPAGPSLPLVTAPGVQGELLAPDERAAPAEPDRDLFGEPVVRTQEPKEPSAATAVPEGQQDLGLDFQREYADMATERERLRQQPQTPEVKARVAELTEQMQLYTQSDIESIRAEKELADVAAAEDAATRKKFPALAEAPDLLTQPDEVKARTQGELFPGEDLGEGVVEPKIPEAKKPEEPGEPTPVPAYARSGPYQYKLPMRGGEAAQPFTLQNVLDTGIAPSTTKGWFEQNVVGKTQAEVQAMVDKDPTLLDGSGKRAKILRELLAPQPAPFKETPRVEPTPAPTPAVEQRDEPRAGKPSVGVPSEPAAPVAPEPGAGVPTTAGEPVTPDGRGLVSTGRPAVPGTAPQGTEPAAIGTDRQQRIEFGKRLGAAQSYPGSLRGRTNKPAQAAAKRGDFQGVVAALENSKNAAVAEVARRAKSLGTKIEIDDTAGETYEGRSQFQDQMSIDGAKMHLEALGKLREMAPQVAKLRPGAPLPASITNAEVSAISEGKPTAMPLRLRSFVENNHSMFTPLGLPDGAMLRTKEDFDALLSAFEGVTETVGEQDLRLTSTASAVQQGIAGAYDAGTDTIRVPEYFAKDETVLAHEIVHAQAVTAVANPTPAQRPAVQRLTKLYEHVKAELGRREKADEFFRMPYGVTNVQEFIAEGMANPSFQYTLSRIKYKNSTAWDKFTEGLANLLGIKNDNAFTELLTVYGEIAGATTPRTKKAKTTAATEPKAETPQSLQDRLQAIIDDPAASKRSKQTAFMALDSLLDPEMNETAEDRQQNEAYAEKILRTAEQQRGPMFYSIAPTEAPKTPAEAKKLFSTNYTAEDVVDSMGDLTPIEKRGVLGMFKGAQDSERDAAEPGRGVKFRVAVADSAAAIEDKLSGHFNGAVRDSMGKLNPMGLYRQAQDYSKLLLAYFQEGSLQKEKETGQYKVVKAKDGSAPIDVFPMIYAWGQRTGRSKERAEQFASRVIEAYRLEQVLKANPDFPKHIKDADRALLVAEYNADPAFAEMSAAMDKPRLALVDQMVKVGRLSKEQGDEWKSVIGYVPFDRIDDFAERFTAVKKTTGRSPLMLTKNPELKGSFSRPVGNVFENYINTMGWMVGQVMTNDARVQTLRSLEDLGYTSNPSRMPGTKNRTAKAYVKGELMYWDLPSSYDVAAFQELNPPKAKWLQVLGQVSNVLRKSVTILPPFALKQVTDDVQRAIMTSGVKNPGALLRMTLSNFGGLALAELRGIRHPTVSEMEGLGLTGEFDFQQGKPAESLLKDLGYRPRGKFETLMHRLEGITRASDLAVRKAIYDQTIKESKDQLLAQTRAREFINFRRRGSSDFVGAMVTTIPFFNAYIQGMDVLYRAASGKDSSSSVGRAQARRMFYSRAAIAMTLSTFYALGKGDDDEEYNEMDLRTRDSNWILPGGYKLPVPTELGALFKVVPERIVEYMRRQGTPEEQTAWEATRTALAYIFEQYVGRTVPIPQAAKPLLEAWTNYSFFTGRELEGIYQKQQDPSMRRASNTSELAIAIANFSRDVVGVDKISPILVDNALSGYFGSTAGLLVATTDSLLNPTRVDRPLHKYALLSNYLYDPVGTRRMTEFYDEREKVGRANATLAELMKTDLDRAVEYAEKNADVLMMESAINSTLEQLERTRAYRKYLNSKDAAADMSAAEREAELKEIKQMEVELTGWVREAKTSIRQ